MALVRPVDAVQLSQRRGEMRRLYQEVADRIRAMIADGTYPPLSRLPAERDLAQRLNVSRPSLREAMIALEIDGSVEIRMGSGIYVTAAGSGPTRTPSLGESPTEIMQARIAIEGAVVVLAAARMTADGLARLGTGLEAMQAAALSGPYPHEHDRAFHVALARQAGNSVLTRLVAGLFDGRQSRIATLLTTRYENRASWLAAVEEHRGIVEALRQGDALGAQAAMHLHLRQSAARWAEG